MATRAVAATRAVVVVTTTVVLVIGTAPVAHITLLLALLASSAPTLRLRVLDLIHLHSHQSEDWVDFKLFLKREKEKKCHKDTSRNVYQLYIKYTSYIELGMFHMAGTRYIKEIGFRGR